MKKAFAISLLAVLALAGCQVNETVEEVSYSKSFTATIEDSFNGGDTRTSLDDNGNVRWKQGDQISIFAGSTVNEQYQVTDASDGKTSADFNKVTGSGFVGGGEIDNNVAFYPYASTAEIAKSGSAYVISDISLPATQNYAEGSFGNSSFPMAAVTDDTEDLHLKFKNVLGGLKLQLKGTATITSITVTGNNEERLCGDAEVTVSNTSTPSINLNDATAKTVTLDCGEGVALDPETATPFIIALPPMTMEGGFTVVVTDTEGKQMEIQTTKSQSINRSMLLKMPAVTYEGISMSSPLTFTSTGEISISLVKVGSPDDISLEYSINGGAWTAYTVGDAVALTDGEKVSFRAGASGNTSFWKTYDDYHKFIVSGSGTVAASGSIMSLINQEESLVIPSPHCFYSMFYGCTNLTTAPELPATILAEECYSNMFNGCTSLTTAPDLPATTLTGGCYACMFYGCTSLTTAPNLPATTLAVLCCDWMFYGCTSLTTAPNLPATTLAKGCYSNMFSHCIGLTTAPELPATTLAYGCYATMFADCTGLTTAPELPATILAEGCYAGMFAGCTSLTTAPELPATTLAEGCYLSMFAFCSDLTSAPELPATTLVEGCYNQMFYGCSRLNYIKALFTTTPTDTYTKDWVSGVASRGTFVKSKDATWDVTGVNGVPKGWTVIKDNIKDNPLTFTSTGKTSISLVKVGNPNDVSLEYSFNGGAWTSYSVGDVIALANGEKVSFRAGVDGNSSFGKFFFDNYHKFIITGGGKVAASGDIMSLLDREGSLTISSSNCFCRLFDGCASLTTAPELPATTLVDHCYEGMFLGCTSLTSAPELPATTLTRYCYSCMFQDCTGLTTAPELPATTLADNCYEGMFHGCTSLTTAPELPATTLAYHCYGGMFGSCTGLTTAPELPATTLAEDCYIAMFDVCYGLTTAPALPATTLAKCCYAYMFNGCRGLITAPNLPATSLAKGCYEGMFECCSSLTTAPRLPATTLAENCYSYMFSECTSLTAAPELPATTLAENCYSYMLRGCTKLNYIKALFTTTPSDTYTKDWVSGVASTGTFVKSKDATWDVTGVNGVPSGWTVIKDNIKENPLTFTSTGKTSISIVKVGSPDDVSLEYCVNGGAWTAYTVGNAIDLADREKVSFRAGVGGNISFSKSSTNYHKFTVIGSGTVAASGSVMTLLNQEESLIIPSEYCFLRLFSGCIRLTSAPKLPATTLALKCYQSMFVGCTSLATAPELPATTLAFFCYNSMFSGCTGLITAPELPATRLASGCYSNMFSGCTSLTTAPDLPATALASSCYWQMFRQCTSLVNAPELPATTLASSCYWQMFKQCTSLVNAPELPATILTESCYNELFYGCSSLKYIKALFTTTPDDTYTKDWVSGVASTGTFVKSKDATWDVTGVNGIPEGWTALTE